uniref:Uncharacterized protein n=1 Tax=Arion vulgaris TaxID=1028688 RepID=A0A0B6ZUT3_9EUPU
MCLKNLGTTANNRRKRSKEKDKMTAKEQEYTEMKSSEGLAIFKAGIGCKCCKVMLVSHECV